MKTARLGKDGPEITRIGFGAWALGGGDWVFGWGPQQDKESIDTIHEALDLGVNWIDTAACYGCGHSETVVGKAIKGRRDKVLVFTKGGLVWDDKGAIRRCLEADSIEKEIDDSLKRLDIDCIDLYQIHWPGKKDEEIEAAWGAIAKAVEAGKIRYAGVSNFSPEQMQVAASIHPVTSLQPPYSLVARQIEGEILPHCDEHGIGVIVYSPLQSGLLTGKYNAESIAKLPDNDWRKDKSDQFKEPKLSANLALIEGLRKIADKHSASVAQVAIAWTLAHKAVTGAIVGARRLGQMVETSKAADLDLTQDDRDTIQGLLKARDTVLAE